MILDAIVDYLPSPADIHSLQGVNPDTQKTEQRLLTAQEPLAALVFKIVTDPYAGRIAYVRVYSGELKNSANVLNPRLGKKFISFLMSLFMIIIGQKRDFCV